MTRPGRGVRRPAHVRRRLVAPATIRRAHRADPPVRRSAGRPRDPELTEHGFPEMVRSRVFGILAGYQDQNDHDTLRTDTVFKPLAGRSPHTEALSERAASARSPGRG